jgi:hypothetical protein
MKRINPSDDARDWDASTRNQSSVIRRPLPRKADFSCFEHYPDLES